MDSKAVDEETDYQSSDYILKQINDMKTDIEAMLQQFDGLDKTQIKLSFDDLNGKYEALNKLVSDSSLYLPKYSQKSALNVLNSLRSQINDKKDHLIPKSKFSFKTSLKANKKSVKVDAEAVDQTDGCRLDSELISFYGFKNISDCHELRMSEEEANGQNIVLDSLTNCLIEIRGAPNALKVNNLLDCKVFCGPITTSALVSNCHKCLLKIASQQLRIHTSSECDMYVHVTSRTIIEESTRIRFKAYDWSYDSIDKHFKLSNLDRSYNNWRQIDDFDCLSNEKPSKNWSFIDWIWIELRLIMWWSLD